jgi:hypothetical protein
MNGSRDVRSRRDAQARPGAGQAAQRRKRQENRLAKPQIVTALGIERYDH